MKKIQYNVVSRLIEEARSAFIDQYGMYDSLPTEEIADTISMFAVAIIASRLSFADRTTMLKNLMRMVLNLNVTDVERYIDDYLNYQAEDSDVTELKPFQRVLTRDSYTDLWHINIYEYHSPSRPGYRCIRNTWLQCVPYNEETRHLLGTRKAAPEKYTKKLTKMQENKE